MSHPLWRLRSMTIQSLVQSRNLLFTKRLLLIKMQMTSTLNPKSLNRSLPMSPLLGKASTVVCDFLRSRLKVLMWRLPLRKTTQLQTFQETLRTRTPRPRLKNLSRKHRQLLPSSSQRQKGGQWQRLRPVGVQRSICQNWVTPPRKNQNLVFCGFPKMPSGSGWRESSDQASKENTRSQMRSWSNGRPRRARRAWSKSSRAWASHRSEVAKSLWNHVF